MHNLQFDYPGKRVSETLFSGLEMNAYPENHPGRATIEQQIQSAYQINFGARIRHFMPGLIAANRPGQAAHLSFGLCGAGEQALFLENHLSKPIQQLLSQAVRNRVERTSIAEIGNLTYANTDNHERYHESLNNLTPADVYYGRGQAILDRREKIKLETLAMRKQMHYDRRASQLI